MKVPAGANIPNISGIPLILLNKAIRKAPASGIATKSGIMLAVIILLTPASWLCQMFRIYRTA